MQIYGTLDRGVVPAPEGVDAGCWCSGSVVLARVRRHLACAMRTMKEE